MSGFFCAFIFLIFNAPSTVLRNKSLLALLLLFSLAAHLHAQDAFMDSLKTALKNAEDDRQKVTTLVGLSQNSFEPSEALGYAKEAVKLSAGDQELSLSWNQVAWSHKNLYQFDSALLAAKKAYGHAQQTGDAMTVSDVLNTYGSIHNNQSNFDSALYYHKKALVQRQQTDDQEAQAISMNNISIVLERLGRYDSASFYIDQSIAIYEALGLTRRMADTYLNKGNLYTNAGKLDMAYESFQNALKTYEELGLDIMMTYALINMGTVALELGQVNDALRVLKRSEEILMNGNKNARLLAFTYTTMGQAYQEKSAADSAIVAYLKGADYAKQAQSKYLVSASYNSLGQLYEKAGDNRKAIQYFSDALALKEEIGDESGMSSVYAGLGRVYTEMRKFGKAKEALTKAEEKAEATGDLTEIEAAYYGLYALAKERGNYSRALDYYEKMSVVKDSLLNAKHLGKVAELNTQYDTEKKEQQIALQEASLGEQEARLQRNQLLITALVVAAMLLIVVLILLRTRSQKEKALIKKEADLKLREAEISAVINSQEKERNRFARDLHDGFGQMISVLKLNMGQLKDLNSRDLEKREEVFRNGEQVINDMYGELRNICFDLMPQTLVKNGLGAALNEFGERVSQNTTTHCEVMLFDLDERLPELIEISLFRTTQEWVNNVLKYAGAETITIQLTRGDSELTLTIEDDGQGFDPQNFYKGTGNGWKNIQSRLNQIGGEFHLESKSGISGTMMIVNVPLPGASRKEVSNIQESKIS